MLQGLAIVESGGTPGTPWRAGLLGACYGKAGQVDRGFETLAQAFAAQQNGENFYDAELHRIEGDLILTKSVLDESSAEACYRKALEVARSQNAQIRRSLIACVCEIAAPVESSVVYLRRRSLARNCEIRWLLTEYAARLCESLPRN